MDYALHERILRLRESFAALTDRLGQVYAGVPAGTAEAEWLVLGDQDLLVLADQFPILSPTAFVERFLP